MKGSVIRFLVTAGLMSAALAPVCVAAEEAAKTLPTLLIKGEVVSTDTNDPAASLLKVKDRYGFETPIYLTPETKIAKGDQALKAADLAQGTAVEVEYNFDINTAKRHAVSVKVSAPAVSASPAAMPAATMTPPAVSTPVAAPAMTPPATTDASAQPAASSEPASAPASTSEQPAKAAN